MERCNAVKNRKNAAFWAAKLMIELLLFDSNGLKRLFVCVKTRSFRQTACVSPLHRVTRKSDFLRNRRDQHY